VYSKKDAGSSPNAPDEIIPPHMLWRAAVSLECFYDLLSQNFRTLISLNLCYDAQKTNVCLFATISEAIADFVIIAASSKSGISSVVLAAREDADVGIGTGSVFNNDDFELKTFHPLVIARGRDIVKVRFE